MGTHTVGLAAAVIVTLIVSVSVAPSSSVTVRVMVYVPGAALLASNVPLTPVVSKFPPEVHTYETIEPSVSLLPLPLNVMVPGDRV